MFYVQMKTQIKLFVDRKVIRFQTEQTENMMDVIPDKLLVCSQERLSDLKPETLYNNRQMIQFFGTDLVKQAQENKKADSRSKSAFRTPKKITAFNKKIFKGRSDPWQAQARDQAAADNVLIEENHEADTELVSLQDLVTRHN